MRVLIPIIVLFAWTNCSKKSDHVGLEAETDDSVLTIKNKDLTEYLSTLDKVELPVIIRGCDDANAGKRTLERGKEIEITNVNSFYKSYHHPYGQFSTGKNFSAIITFNLADCLIPELVTLDINGVQIDRKSIAIGYCGSDCGYSCNEFMRIDKDFTIYASDTIQSYDCDSLGNMIPETEKNYVIYKQGKLLPTGKIELSAELRKELGVK